VLLCSLLFVRGRQLFVNNLPAQQDKIVTPISLANVWIIPLEITLSGVRYDTQYVPNQAAYMNAFSAALATVSPPNARLLRATEGTASTGLRPPIKEGVPPVASNVTSAVAAPRRLLQDTSGNTTVIMQLFLAPAGDGSELSSVDAHRFGEHLLSDGTVAIWSHLQASGASAGVSPTFAVPSSISLSISDILPHFNSLPNRTTTMVIADGRADRSLPAPTAPSAHSSRKLAAWKVTVLACSCACALSMVAVIIWWWARASRRAREAAGERAIEASLSKIPPSGRPHSADQYHTVSLSGSAGTQAKSVLVTSGADGSGVSLDATQSWVSRRGYEANPLLHTTSMSSTDTAAHSTCNTLPLQAELMTPAQHTATRGRPSVAAAEELVCDVATRSSGGTSLQMHVITAATVQAFQELHAHIAVGDVTFADVYKLHQGATKHTLVPHSLRMQATGPGTGGYEVHLATHAKSFQNERELFDKPELVDLFAEVKALAPLAAADLRTSAWMRWKVLKCDGSLQQHRLRRKAARNAWPLLESMRVLGQVSMRMEALHSKGVPSLHVTAALHAQHWLDRASQADHTAKWEVVRDLLVRDLPLQARVTCTYTG
jgi:hypothetical protein